MSKRAKRMPWQEPPPDVGPSTPMRIEDLPPDMRRLLAMRPRRNPDVRWEEDEETGLVTVIYAKNLSRVERILSTIVKPVPEIRRPLDIPGSFIWLMCDGETAIATICTAVDEAFKEEMEPVLERVVGFLEILAKRGLVIVEEEADEA